MNKENINVSCDLNWIVTGFATLGSMVNGYDTTDYPDNFIESFDIGKFKYLKDEKRVVEVEGFSPTPPSQEPTEVELLRSSLLEQGKTLQEQQAIIQQQSEIMGTLMEQIATLGLVVAPTPKESE